MSLTPGILRDKVARFSPWSKALDIAPQLKIPLSRRGIHKGMPDPDPTGPRMPALLRSAGFDTDGGKVQVGAGTKVFSGPETRKWLA
jgi:hypothetical protein